MTHWLKCKIAPGQFSAERAVSFKAINGETVSLFAEHDDMLWDLFVKGEGLIRVQIRERKGNKVMIRLPTESLEHGYTLTVAASEVE